MSTAIEINAYSSSGTRIFEKAILSFWQMNGPVSNAPAIYAPHQRFAAHDLLQFAEDVVAAIGASRSDARAVATNLVEADMRGVATHGVVRLPSYRRQVEDGEVDVKATPSLVRGEQAAVLVDGRHAFGAVTADFCLELATERAHKYGVAAASAYHCTHFGAAAHYTLRAARAGFVAIVAANTPAVMAPAGGKAAAIGNNPLSVGAPMPAGRDPVVLDMAQSVVARGRIKLAEMRGDSIPADWAVDVDGVPTSDANAALTGALLAFGGYKGYGLAVAVEILTSVLAGAGLSPELVNTSMTGTAVPRPGAVVGSVGHLFLVLDPNAFVGRPAFESAMARFVDALKSVDPAPGHDEVLLPGELEARAARAAARDGVPLAPATIQLLSELGQNLSVSLPEVIQQ
jgi:LDH2 family malate/lactate/ureidoglycolate dehydrogenase